MELYSKGMNSGHLLFLSGHQKLVRHRWWPYSTLRIVLICWFAFPRIIDTFFAPTYLHYNNQRMQCEIKNYFVPVVILLNVLWCSISNMGRYRCCPVCIVGCHWWLAIIPTAPLWYVLFRARINICVRIKCIYCYFVGRRLLSMWNAEMKGNDELQISPFISPLVDFLSILSNDYVSVLVDLSLPFSSHFWLFVSRFPWWLNTLMYCVWCTYFT